MIDNPVTNQRTVPDPTKCRTKVLAGYLAFTYCLVEPPNRCEFAVPFGDDLLCRHPDRRRFENLTR